MMGIMLPPDYAVTMYKCDKTKQKRWKITEIVATGDVLDGSALN